MDAARFQGRPPDGVPHRDWRDERFLSGRSPLLEDVNKRSPRPAVHAEELKEGGEEVLVRKPAQSPTMLVRDHYGRERLVHSPHVPEGFAHSPHVPDGFSHSPRTPYSDGRPPSRVSDGQRSPKVSPAPVCDDDGRPRRPASHGQLGGEGRMADKHPMDPHLPHRTDNHLPDGHHPMYNIGGHPVHPGAPRPHPQRSPAAREYPPSSVPSVVGYPAGIYPHLEGTSANPQQAYAAGRYIYPGMPAHASPHALPPRASPHALPPHVSPHALQQPQRDPARRSHDVSPSPSPSPAAPQRTSRDTEPSPLLSAQYETLSDDE